MPATYVEWRHCIEVECAIALTATFVATRLQSLGNAGSEEAARFIRLYGKAHWQNVLGWFAQAQVELRDDAG